MAKFLIVAPSWVGDMVMSQTLLYEIKQQHGVTCRIDVLVNAWASDIVKRMPEVTCVIPNPFKHGELKLWQRFKLGLSLRKAGYTQAYVLPNSFKSALIPFFAAIPRRSGWLGEWRYGLLNDYYQLNKLALPLMIDRFSALAHKGHKPAQIRWPRFMVDKLKQEQILQQLGLNLARPVIALCPGAEFGPAKRWPTSHFADLAIDLQQQGYQLWLLGSEKDLLLANEIMALAKQEDMHNLCGRTNLAAVVDLFACAKVVVSNDSGLMHIACAVSVPVVAIYGSSSPDFTPPLAQQAQICQINLACSPCFQRQCKFGHYDCLYQISPLMISARIKLLLSTSSAALS